MSELKEMTVYDAYWKATSNGDNSIPVYLKSEADKVIAEKDAEIAELKEEHRWRKFSEEKPEKDAWCLVYHEGEIDADHYTDECNNHCRFVMYGNLVTHWMPLPSAPKEE